jgi:hypothetical protein
MTSAGRYSDVALFLTFSVSQSRYSSRLTFFEYMNKANKLVLHCQKYLRVKKGMLITLSRRWYCDFQ